MKHPSPSTAQPASPGDRRLHRSGSLVGALIAAGLTLAAPYLHAQKGGGKGKPGGGEEPPPPPVEAVYDAVPIPRPSWGDSYQVLNFNNNGDLVGKITAKIKGVNRNVLGFLWTNGAHRALPGLLPGHDSTEPVDISDDGTIIVGNSRSNNDPYGVYSLAAWVDLGGGNYSPVNLSARVEEAAQIQLPEWGFTKFRVYGTSLEASVLTSNARFMCVRATLPAESWYPGNTRPYDYLITIVVEWDWTDKLNPTVCDMRVLAERPIPNSPDPTGYRLHGYNLEQGYRDEASADRNVQNVIRVAGDIDEFEAGDGTISSNPTPGTVWQLNLDLETREESLTFLGNVEDGRRRSAYRVNEFGTTLGGGGAVWGMNGEETMIEPLPGATWVGSYAINHGGVVVGETGDVGSTAFIWTATTGTMDLNAPSLVAGNLGLVGARWINDLGWITAFGANSYYILKPKQIATP